MAASSSSARGPPDPSDCIEELAAQHAQWLASELGSDIDAEPEVTEKPKQMLKPKRYSKRAGRPTGDAHFRSVMEGLVDQMQDDTQDDHVPVAPQGLTSLELARAAKKQKAEERERTRANMVIVSRRDGCQEDMYGALVRFDDSANLHCVGTPLQKQLMTLAHSQLTDWKNAQRDLETDPDESVDLVRFFLEDPHHASARSIAKVLQSSRYKVQTVEPLTSACLIEMQSWMTGALFKSMHCRISQDDPDFLPWVWMTTLRYDETPMKIRVPDGEGTCSQAKVLQVEFRWSCLFKKSHCDQGAHFMVESDVMTYLQTMDHQTGENLLSVTSSLMDLPEIKRCLFALCFQFAVGGNCLVLFGFHVPID